MLRNRCGYFRVLHNAKVLFSMLQWLTSLSGTGSYRRYVIAKSSTMKYPVLTKYLVLSVISLYVFA